MAHPYIIQIKKEFAASANATKAAGAKGIILTAKHHDGFSLWPSKYSKHTVRESKWLNGKGDVVKMLSEACKKAGIEMGVYISPWDRNHPDYGTPKYNEVYIQTMKELLTGYGKFFELWWDGANGEGPNGKKQVYDFTRFKDSAMSYQPNILIFSDIGPHIRWVGNENGLINETNWNLLDTAGFKRGEGAPANDTLNRGNFNGKNWIGAEADVSIRKGWFYHEEEDSTVKSGKTLFNLYLNSVGHGGNLLLNVPPNRKGLIAPQDSAALMDFRKIREAAFKTNLFKNAVIKNNKNEVINEIVEDRKELERLMGYSVRGMSYPFGNTNDLVVETISELGIEYARTVSDTYQFNIPSDFLRWHPTIHQFAKAYWEPNQPEKDAQELIQFYKVIDDFLQTKELAILDIWGHSWEMGADKKKWDETDKFFTLLSNNKYVHYSTQIDLVDYINAYRNLKFTVAKNYVTNSAAFSIFIKINTQIFELKAGTTTKLF
mgnify:CR=1 FL=1